MPSEETLRSEPLPNPQSGSLGNPRSGALGKPRSGRVTVAILAYNRPDYLKESIRSVLDQTYRYFKIIVYDDCSPTDLKPVVDEFPDERISYHRNHVNIGQFANAAQAVDLCDTELLVILHDDDRMFPWALERLAGAVDQHPSICAASAMRIHVMGSGDFQHHKNNLNGRLFRKTEMLSKPWRPGNCLIFSGIMLRPSALLEKGVNFRTDAGPAGDLLFWLEVNGIGGDVYGFDTPFIEYRKHAVSATGASAAEEWFQSAKRCAECAESIGLTAEGVSRIRLMLIGLGIGAYASSLMHSGELDIEKLRSKRDEVNAAFGVDITDKMLNEYASVGVLRPLITAVGKGEASVGEYLSRRAELEKAGVKMPLKRRLMWFAKYIIAQRMLGILME